jgi:hypothetical protein
MPVKDGWYSLRNEYDSFGCSTRTTYHGVNGEPVLHKDGYHGMLAEYDDRGNQTATTMWVSMVSRPCLARA